MFRWKGSIRKTEHFTASDGPYRLMCLWRDSSDAKNNNQQLPSPAWHTRMNVTSMLKRTRYYEPKHSGLHPLPPHGRKLLIPHHLALGRFGFAGP